MVDRERFLHRNLLPAAALEAYLAGAAPFVTIAEALAGRGNALTIDDATRAGADAALMARAAGHEVTLFVNPGQVESGAPYHFLLLNALLDQVTGASVEFERTNYPIGTTSEHQALRRVIKDRLRSLTSEEARRELVQQLAQSWRAGPRDVGAPFATLSREALSGLLAAGVELQNHGWSHAFHPALSPPESAVEVSRGREWLRQEFGVDARWFAAPFGDSLPHDVALDCDLWFAFNSEWAEGAIAGGVFNRVDLPVPSPEKPLLRRATAALRGLATRVSGALRQQ